MTIMFRVTHALRCPIGESTHTVRVFSASSEHHMIVMEAGFMDLHALLSDEIRLRSVSSTQMMG